MATLPRYEQQKVLQPVDYPTVPSNLDTTGQSIQAIGKTVADAAAKEMHDYMDLKRQSELVDKTTEASYKLHQMKQEALLSTDFYSDPETAANSFAEKTKALQEKYLSGISDSRVQAAFKSHFAREAISNINLMGDAAIKQRNAMGLGLYETSLHRLETLSDTATTDEEAQKFMGQGVAILKQMQDRGLIAPEKKAEREKSFLNDRAEHRIRTLALSNPQAAIDQITAGTGVSTLLRPDRAAELSKLAVQTRDHQANAARVQQERDEKRLMETQNNTVYQKLYQDFNLSDPDTGDFAGAVRYIENPANAKATGITVKPTDQIKEISGMIETQRTQRIHARDQAQKNADDSLINDTLSGKLTVDKINSYPGASGKGRENAIRWINSDENIRNRTDLKLYGQLTSDIESFKITNKDDLNKYIAAGLGRSEYTQLRNLIDDVNNPEKSPSLRYAKDAFFAKYSENGILPNEVMRLYPRFITQYSEEVRKQGLSGLKTHELADRMLQDVDGKLLNTWFSSTATSLEFAQQYGGWPTPDVGQTSASQPRKQPEMTPEQSSDYERILRDAGQKVTPANIRSLYDQDRARGGK